MAKTWSMLMFIGRNYHVAVDGSNVTNAGLSNVGSANSNMKILVQMAVNDSSPQLFGEVRLHIVHI